MSGTSSIQKLPNEISKNNVIMSIEDKVNNSNVLKQQMSQQIPQQMGQQQMMPNQQMGQQQMMPNQQMAPNAQGAPQMQGQGGGQEGRLPT